MSDLFALVGMVTLAALFAFGVAFMAGFLVPRRRSIRASLPKPVAAPTVTEREQARAWRQQAVEEEHAYWDERFRAAGGIPPMRKAERERLEASPLFGFYLGSNTRMATFAERHESINDMRRRFAQPDQHLRDTDRMAMARPPKPARKEWRTPLRDLVDPAP